MLCALDVDLEKLDKELGAFVGISEGIIQKIVDSHKVKHVACYGFRLSHLRSEEVHWLHVDMGVSSVREKYELAHPPEEWKLKGDQDTNGHNNDDDDDNDDTDAFD
ncbi:hypothetical protein P7K49_026504 [Saguinus oedipus]|uniref:Focal adhesion kinase N-terminal domain-containing protein n=1 Tax=Saguinus oedipus TaxID=9490 RepID=A0ABQ9UDD8_SAGOE|nr:hypothetical protein P7K49_026504 [Saguinus oedipus]